MPIAPTHSRDFSGEQAKSKPSESRARETWDVGGIDGLLAGEAVGDYLFDEEDEGEPALAELPHYPEAVLVDPDVSAPADGVI